jgi:hypothetical protein
MVELVISALVGKRRAGRKVDLVAVAAFGCVESSDVVSVRCGSGTDPQTECGGQRTANADGGSSAGDGFEELRSGRPAKTDSLNSTSTSVNLYDLRGSWQPAAAVWASSPESV